MLIAFLQVFIPGQKHKNPKPLRDWNAGTGGGVAPYWTVSASAFIVDRCRNNLPTLKPNDLITLYTRVALMSLNQ